MRSFVAISISRSGAVLTLILFGMLFALPASVSAESIIEARICDGTTGSSISVQSPLSGDTISVLPVTISGLVANATQIEVTIDGAYDSTVPIGSSQTDFIFDISLNEGTHTVKLVANDKCNYQNGTVDLVLTYHSTTQSNGGTSTTIGQGGQTTGGATTSGIGTGVQIGSQTGSESPTTKSGPIAMLIEPIHAIATALDVDSTLKDGAAQGALRFSLIVSGAFMASVGSTTYISVLEFFRQGAWATKVKKYFAAHHVMRESAFRFSGLALFALAFLI